jgi:hypothetical protein
MVFLKVVTKIIYVEEASFYTFLLYLYFLKLYTCESLPFLMRVKWC